MAFPFFCATFRANPTIRMVKCVTVNKTPKPAKKKKTKTKAVAVKRKIGRPDDYKPEYCQKLIDHMTGGLSIEAFAALIPCSKATIYNWVKIYPEFLNAKKIGEGYSRLFWEKAGIEGMYAPNFSASVWIFNLKNRFGWVDKKESSEDKHIHTVKIELPGQKTEQVISIQPGEGEEDGDDNVP